MPDFLSNDRLCRTMSESPYLLAGITDVGLEAMIPSVRSSSVANAASSVSRFFVDYIERMAMYAEAIAYRSSASNLFFRCCPPTI
jgi:hypothetical protein